MREFADQLAGRLREFTLLKSIVLRAREAPTFAIERFLDIETVASPGRRFDLATRFGDPIPYESIDYVLLHRYMRLLTLRPDDVVFDIGCGMGRMLCLFARKGVRRCVGVEFDPELAEIARENGVRLRGRRAPIDIWCGDASEADYSGGTVFWMFNPFGAKTMEIVLGRIEQSIRDRSRGIQIAYINPVHESAFRACGWLTCTRRIEPVLFKTYSASYWSNQTPE
ncbi:MAG: class I SAM-dependent methyltransferase [Phycisphaerales bacterium]|nr:class I SAM-dependent methyltransferase [Phycisphaerales bacterium]MCI0629909.1 class I SAM-dependent methyltransferase [Phycisphaerales bacterium]MCI0677146.1 class I SAM-dependent methyltransferase [Phycisphaerales bacterium]